MKQYINVINKFIFLNAEDTENFLNIQGKKNSNDYLLINFE